MLSRYFFSFQCFRTAPCVENTARMLSVSTAISLASGETGTAGALVLLVPGAPVLGALLIEAPVFDAPVAGVVVAVGAVFVPWLAEAPAGAVVGGGGAKYAWYSVSTRSESAIARKTRFSIIF